MTRSENERTNPPRRVRDDVVAVIPAFRCAATIGPLVARLREHLDRVVVVDDGSDDATAAEAAAQGADVVRRGVNGGKGRALARGVATALGGDPSALVLLDGDGQHDPDDVPALVAAWEEGADLVIGARLADGDLIPRVRYWTNYIGSRALSWMTGRELEDSQSGYRVLDAGLARKLRLSSAGYAVESEMLIKAAKRGATIAHVPVKVIYDGAVSHFSPLADTLRIVWWSVYYKVFDDDPPGAAPVRQAAGSLAGLRTVEGVNAGSIGAFDQVVTEVTDDAVVGV